MVICPIHMPVPKLILFPIATLFRLISCFSSSISTLDPFTRPQHSLPFMFSMRTDILMCNLSAVFSSAFHMTFLPHTLRNAYIIDFLHKFSEVLLLFNRFIHIPEQHTTPCLTSVLHCPFLSYQAFLPLDPFISFYSTHVFI